MAVLDEEHSDTLLLDREESRCPLSIAEARTIAEHCLEYPDPNAAAEHLIKTRYRGLRGLRRPMPKMDAPKADGRAIGSIVRVPGDSLLHRELVAMTGREPSDFGWTHTEVAMARLRLAMAGKHSPDVAPGLALDPKIRVPRDSLLRHELIAMTGKAVPDDIRGWFWFPEEIAAAQARLDANSKADVDLDQSANEAGRARPAADMADDDATARSCWPRMATRCSPTRPGRRPRPSGKRSRPCSRVPTRARRSDSSTDPVRAGCEISVVRGVMRSWSTWQTCWARSLRRTRPRRKSPRCFGTAPVKPGRRARRRRLARTHPERRTPSHGRSLRPSMHPSVLSGSANCLGNETHSGEFPAAQDSMSLSKVRRQCGRGRLRRVADPRPAPTFAGPPGPKTYSGAAERDPV